MGKIQIPAFLCSNRDQNGKISAKISGKDKRKGTFAQAESQRKKGGKAACSPLVVIKRDLSLCSIADETIVKRSFCGFLRTTVNEQKEEYFQKYEIWRRFNTKILSGCRKWDLFPSHYGLLVSPNWMMSSVSRYLIDRSNQTSTPKKTCHENKDGGVSGALGRGESSSETPAARLQADGCRRRSEHRLNRGAWGGRQQALKGRGYRKIWKLGLWRRTYGMKMRDFFSIKIKINFWWENNGILWNFRKNGVFKIFPAFSRI